MNNATLASVFGVGTSLCALMATATHLTSLPKKSAIVAGCSASVSIYALLFFEREILSLVRKEHEVFMFCGAALIIGSLLTTYGNRLFINSNVSVIASSFLFTGSLTASIALLWSFERLTVHKN